LRQSEQLTAVEGNAARDARHRRQQAEQGERAHALARARLADDSQRLTLANLVRQPADHPGRTAPGAEGHGELIHGEQAHVVTPLPDMTDRCFGSRTSRSASPSTLNASTTTKIARPGNTTIHQACSMNWRPSASIRPHDGSGGW